MSIRLVFLILLLSAWACVPKPQDITGCGSGMEFNNETLGCVSSSPAITLATTFTSLAVVEDQDTSFTLPSATSEATGSLYWFIITPPNHGDITDCADRDSSGAATGTGTSLRSCVFTPDSNFVGTDAFSYRICNSETGSTRCGDTISVAVTITDDGLDIPTITSATEVSAYENASISFDIRAQRTSSGEANPIYLCMDVIDPDGVMASEAATKVVSPSGALVFGSTCTLIANENDNLSPILANFSATANLLACPLDDCTGEAFVMLRMCESATCNVGGIDGVDNDADGEIDEEDEWNTTDLQTVSVRRVAITTTARNFAPVIGGLNPLSLTSFAEGAAAMTIGTAGGNDRVLSTATDTDGDAITYEYIPTSFYPSTAGTFSCTNGTNLACTFTPDADFNGAINFRYLARDSKNVASNIVTVTITATGVNDAPIFISGTHLAGYASTPVALSESTTLTDRTFRVGEGGGGFENSQTLKMTATSSDNTILPPGSITVKRGSTLLGALSNSTPLTLDGATIDADVQSFSMSFTPTAGLVSSTPITITLTIDDGQALSNTATYAFNFTGVGNVDNAPSVGLDPATTLGFQQGGSAKNLTFRTTPGANDWANVTNGLQSMTYTVASSNTSVVDASALTLSTSAGGISITKGTGASCTASSCVFTIAYDGTNDPSDDDINLAVTPGVRGTSTLTMTFSDGNAANNITKSSTVNVYNYTATFNGWKDVKFTGRIYGKQSSFIRGASMMVGWENLTLLEGGSPVTAYTVRVYRKLTNDFSSFPATSLEEDGVSATANEATFLDSAGFDDGSGWTSGQRYYIALAIIPNALGTPVYPTAASDQVLEVLVPPDNMALVHRWMANKRFCESTGQTPDRAGGTYRCYNKGLGGVNVSGTFYYDQADHLFMNVYEAGCPYNYIEDVRAIAAGTAPGSLHYERSTGECRLSDGTSWNLITSSIAGPVTTHLAELPPLVKISHTDAHGLCSKQAVNCAGSTCAAVPAAGLVGELPSRREMVAASVWPGTIPGGLTADPIENTGNHSAYQACNTYSGLGLSFNDMPVALTSDTLPYSSMGVGGKALLNSASASNYCESRYGLRNHIGNVEEWLADKFDCNSTTPPYYACDMVTALGSGRDDSDPANNSFSVSYSFDGAASHGPELGDGFGYLTMDNFMDAGVDRFNVAVGLPAEIDGGVTGIQYGLPNYFSPATPPNQVDGNLWSYDGIKIYGAGNSVNYAGVQGGAWADQGSSGRFALGLREGSDVSTQTGYRCVMRISPVP